MKYSIKDILNKIQFHNTSYKEYLGIYDKYIISVYPFDINIFDACINDKPILYNDLYHKYLNKRQFHHIDFINAINILDEEFIYDIDPCDAYDIVSGHNNFSNNIITTNMIHKKIHTEDIISFESDVRSYKRDQKLIELGIV